MTVTNNNRIMKQTEGPLLCVEAADAVTLDYYQNHYLPPLEKIFAEFGHASILFYYPDRESFPGWSEEAADLNIQKLTEFGRKISKVALIDPPEKVASRWTLLQPLISGEIRIFGHGQLDDAMTWIKA